MKMGKWVFLGLVFVANHTLADEAKPDLEARIERVVNGLLPSGVFRNESRYGEPVSLKERMAYYHTPGVSIAVVNSNKIEWARGFGVLEHEKNKPVTETTLFQAASISKPIFAMAVMRMVQDGKLDLDEDVNKYLVDWKIPANGTWQPRITLRQILSHSAGLTVHGFPGYRRSETIPSMLEILNGGAPANTPRIEVNLFPGVTTRYSGGGTTVAGKLVADVAKKPFAEIMQELIFTPLGMQHSSFEQPLPRNLARSAATAHPSKNHAIPGKWHVYPELAPDALWTTPSDLARAGIAMQKAVKGEPDSILSRKLAEEMLTPVLGSVGIGWMIDGKSNSVRFSHGGANEGYLCQMTMYKDLGMGAVVMINSNEGDFILREIERSIAREYEWPDTLTENKKPLKLAGSILDAYVGDYESTNGFKCKITRQNDILLLKHPQQSAVELHPESETKFFIKVLNTDITFNSPDNGKVVSLTLRQERDSVVADKKQN